MLIVVDVFYGDVSGKGNYRSEGDIFRNESLDSVFGDSDDEVCVLVLLELGYSCDRIEEFLEVELFLLRF